MPTDIQKARAVFLHAVGRLPPEEWDAHVAAACDGDEGLRQQVADLLRLHREAGSFLNHPAALGPMGTIPQTPADGTAAFVQEGAGTVIGPYKLLQQIGEGGMGTVYMAEQTRPVRRKVALKVIKPGMDSRPVVARFEAERQALAMMDHVNIARVFDGGATDGGRPYFVMELVHGVPITRYCDDNHLAPRQRLELFVQVCHAIQHAHQKGIIHRDVKPSNVMVTLYDGKPVPKVIDFGVAKATDQKLTERTLFTQYGTMVGTLEYMSPEQAEMSALGVDTRSDIYSLGVLLYELLTGGTPLGRQRVKQAAYADILRMIREEDPPRPSNRLSTSGEALATISTHRRMDPAKLTRLVRGELDWIVMKALEKDRGRRYETASGFAADVERYLADEPVLACPPSVGYRFRKFARRNRAALVTATAVGLMVAVAAAVSTVLIWRANQDLHRTVEHERREAYFHRISLAHRDVSGDNLARALNLLAECPEDLRDWEWHYLMRLCKVEPVILRDTTEVNGVAFSPDGGRLASAGGDGAVKVRNGRTGKVVQTLANAHARAVVCVTFHPDGQHLASVGADRRVKVWELATEKELFDEPCDAVRKFGTAYTVAFSADGRRLAAASDGAVRIWDWKGRQLLHSLPPHKFHSIPVAFSPDGRRLATGTFREGLRLWDPETGRLLRTIPAHGHPLSALAFSADGKVVASSSFDRTVKLSDATTGEVFHTLDLHTGNVECVALSSDGKRVASAGEDKTVRLWDATTGREVLGLHGHGGRCGCVAFSPDGRRLASASADGTIRFWDATPLGGDEGQEIRTFARHGDEIRSLAFSPDNKRVASAGTDATVKVWDATTGLVSVEYGGHARIVFSVAWRADGERIASAGLDGTQQTVKVWDARSGREVVTLRPGRKEYAAPYSVVAFSPDGRHLVTGSVSGDVQIWDAETGQEVQSLRPHGGEVRGLTFSAKGDLASASSDGVVTLWDATRLGEKQEGRLFTDRARVPGPSLNVAFSPDGRRLVTGGEDNTVKVWDVPTGRELDTLRGHTGEVYAIAVSGDGRWIASGGGDSTVKVWDSRTGKLARSFRGHENLISGLAFSPDGSRLVSGSRDHTVKVWDVSNLDAELTR